MRERSGTTHVYGCEQNLELVGNVYALHAGFNEYAESNDMIVLYPYVVSNPTTNPKGCWDWWGYNNPYYGIKTGIQIEFVTRMVERKPIAQSTQTKSDKRISLGLKLLKIRFK